EQPFVAQPAASPHTHSSDSPPGSQHSAAIAARPRRNRRGSIRDTHPSFAPPGLSPTLQNKSRENVRVGSGSFLQKRPHTSPDRSAESSHRGSGLQKLADAFPESPSGTAAVSIETP